MTALNEIDLEHHKLGRIDVGREHLTNICPLCLRSDFPIWDVTTSSEIAEVLDLSTDSARKAVQRDSLDAVTDQYTHIIRYSEAISRFNALEVGFKYWEKDEPCPNCKRTNDPLEEVLVMGMIDDLTSLSRSGIRQRLLLSSQAIHQRRKAGKTWIFDRAEVEQNLEK